MNEFLQARQKLRFALSAGMLTEGDSLDSKLLPAVTGFDSLELVELVMALEEKYGGEIRTVGDLAERMYEVQTEG